MAFEAHQIIDNSIIISTKSLIFIHLFFCI